ncbi:response regulator transcription factor [Paenibacillus sp. GSMTC-2017]|uniref:response regulator transcription factor n=1 Tax=Paenibacillus sp. GSMTC-2017 TaxID=2794350 RepID=UPI0018DA2949|nr:response regulator transcription factor [Paenibacillus sp. GSMTC-2017]MBH5317622.1 response regulator transcription factor [Paenibacillus sp. GSMTC-2017]
MTSYSVLLVEDECRITEIMTDYFERDRWTVYAAKHGKEAMERFQEAKIDLVVLDISMPEMDGWSVCRLIRKQSSIPIIIVTARSDDEDKLMGFELGADDFVTKPFSPKVLIARASMLMKRAYGTVGLEHHIVSFGHVVINKQARNVEICGVKIELAPKEFELLCCLVRNKGIVMKREALLNHVWGFDYIGDDRVVDTHIKKLRAKLATEAQHIVTVKGVGYKLEVNL